MSIINSNNLTKYDNVENVQNSVDNSSRYIVGKNYTLQVDLNVRYGAGTSNAIKKYNELTVDGKKHAYIQTNAVLKKGTVVTCLEIVKNGQDIWLKIPSGYVAGYYQGKEYIK